MSEMRTRNEESTMPEVPADNRSSSKAARKQKKSRRQQGKRWKVLIQDVLGDFSDQTGAYF